MFSMFASKKEVVMPEVTVEETEKFLSELIVLISEAKGTDPKLSPFLELKDKWTTAECMGAIANEIKWALDQNEKILGRKVTVTVTDANHQSVACKIVNATFTTGQSSFESLALFLMTAYRSYEAVPEGELKNEFIHHCATYLHRATKDWVTKKGGWVGAYIDAAEEQAVLNLIGLDKKTIASLLPVAKFCIAGLCALVLTGAVFGIASSYNAPRPM